MLFLIFCKLSFIEIFICVFLNMYSFGGFFVYTTPISQYKKNISFYFKQVFKLFYSIICMWIQSSSLPALHFECWKVHKWIPVYNSGQRQSCDLVAWRFFGFSPPQCAWSLLLDPKLDVPKKLWLAFESHPAIYKGSLDSWLVVLH